MPPPAPAHVALVGCGFTGTSTLLQLIDTTPVRQITVFESRDVFGPGYAWQPDACADYLVNNTTDTLCLLPGNRQAFLQWLQGRGEAPDPRGHRPRRDYGAFLAEAVRAAQVLAAAKGIALRCVPATVTGLSEPPGGGVLLRWPGGELHADVAILSTGRCPDQPLLAPPPTGSQACCVPTHIGDTRLDALPLDATCHVLGASLSAYDVVNRLFGPATGCRFTRAADGRLQFEPGPNQRRVLLCSRSGRLKKIESRQRMSIRRTVLTEATLAARAAAEGGLTLEALVELINEEAQAHGVTLDWPALRDTYTGCTQADTVTQRAAALLQADITAACGGHNFLVDLAGNCQMLLWDAFAARRLQPLQEQRYRREAETAVRCWTAPCPVPTAERLLALMQAGRLEVRHGTRTPRWSATEDAWHVDTAFGTERATVLVNATGTVDRRVDSPAQSPLLQQLVAQGLLRPYRLAGQASDGADVDMASFRAAGSCHVHVLNMLLWGPGFFTSSAFVMAQLASRLLDHLYGPGRSASRA